MFRIYVRNNDKKNRHVWSQEIRNMFESTGSQCKGAIMWVMTSLIFAVDIGGGDWLQHSV